MRCGTSGTLGSQQRSSFDPATVKDRLNTLRNKITQLTERHDELVEHLAETPALPPAMVLDELTDHITEIIRSGNPAQRKTLIEALVAEVKITGPNTILPVFRIPQATTTPGNSAAHNGHSPTNTEAVAAQPATTASGEMVRTMIEPVELRGLEPLTLTLPV